MYSGANVNQRDRCSRLSVTEVFLRCDTEHSRKKRSCGSKCLCFATTAKAGGPACLSQTYSSKEAFVFSSLKGTNASWVIPPPLTTDLCPLSF